MIGDLGPQICLEALKVGEMICQPSKQRVIDVIPI